MQAMSVNSTINNNGMLSR